MPFPDGYQQAMQNYYRSKSKFIGFFKGEDLVITAIKGLPENEKSLLQVLKIFMAD